MTEQLLTKVIFRYWDHSVIALFPELPADTRSWLYSDSYQSADGHGSANAEMIVHESRPATPAEYAALKTELESAPYHYRLIVRSRISPQTRAARELAWHRLMNHSLSS